MPTSAPSTATTDCLPPAPSMTAGCGQAQWAGNETARGARAHGLSLALGELNEGARHNKQRQGHEPCTPCVRKRTHPFSRLASAALPPRWAQSTTARTQPNGTAVRLQCAAGSTVRSAHRAGCCVPCWARTSFGVCGAARSAQSSSITTCECCSDRGGKYLGQHTRLCPGSG